MVSDVMVNVLAGMLAAISLGLLPVVWRAIARPRSERNVSRSSYQQKTKGLVEDLLQAGRQTDQLLEEITEVTGEREKALLSLEQEVMNLATREEALRNRVEALQDEETSTVVAQYLAEQMHRAERRSAFRDYLLFVSGVIVTTVVSIVLRVSLGV